MTTVEFATPDRLDDAQIRAVRALATKTAQADGVAPLSDQALLALARSAPDQRHILALDDGQLVGYLGFDPQTRSAEMFVDPSRRRRRIGSGFIVKLRVMSGAGLTSAEREVVSTRTVLADGPRLWAHGDLACAQAFFGQLGFVKIRELWLLGREIPGPIPPPDPIDGIDITPFRPGVDEEAWLAANAAIFADHPEQGAWQLDDLKQREAEPWFDPALLLLARRGPDVVGFVWIKVQGEDGEIYVLGVMPAARSLGLGRHLLARALHEISARGLVTSSLYVDGDNARAVGLYREAGFEALTADGQYAYPA